MSTTIRQGLYLALSAAGVILPWKNNLEWMDGFASVGDASITQFWADAFATPVSSSLAWDIVIMGAVGFVLVVVESRRLGMRWWPLIYLVLANGVAAAFAFPLFLFFRERRLAAM